MAQIHFADPFTVAGRTSSVTGPQTTLATASCAVKFEALKYISVCKGSPFMSMSTHELFRYDSDIGYTFTPNLKMRVPHESGAYLLQTNDLGFRDGALTSDDRPRVFVFGDSFTAGDGVSNGKRWTDELARLLPGISIQNFGLSGSGTDQQYLAWRKFAKDHPCDLVIVAVLVENVRRVTSAYRAVEGPGGEVLFRAKPYYTLEDGELVRHHDPVPPQPVPADRLDGPEDTGGRYPALRKLISQLGLKPLIQQMTGYQPVPDFDSSATPGWRLLRAILERWSSECPYPMAIVPLPLYQHVEDTADASAYQARFAELGAQLGRPVIDPLPELRGYDPQTRRGFRFRKDVHLTADGHAAMARALAPALRDLLGVPS